MASATSRVAATPAKARRKGGRAAEAVGDEAGEHGDSAVPTVPARPSRLRQSV